MNRLNTYGAFLRDKFGERVHRVCVDAGFTCPNRDGKVAVGGCTYCNNASFTPHSVDRKLPLKKQITRGMEHLRRRYGPGKFLVYFQPYTNTYAPRERLERLYREALDVEGVVGLVVGTRSDCIDNDILDMLEEIAAGTFLTVEFGIESVYDETLARINRGHDYDSVKCAVADSKGRGFLIGGHVILGFPWETQDMMLDMADEVSALGLDMLKIHSLHIVKGTALAEEHNREPFHLLSYARYVELAADFLERLDPSIVIERIAGEAPPDLLLAPRWGRKASIVLRDVKEELRRRDTRQGILHSCVEEAVV